MLELTIRSNFIKFDKDIFEWVVKVLDISDAVLGNNLTFGDICVHGCLDARQ
jgi:hypothetical protein